MAGGGSVGNRQASEQRCVIGCEERENIISIMKRTMLSMSCTMGCGMRLEAASLRQSHNPNRPPILSIRG
jgi:hypothetical protein